MARPHNWSDTVQTFTKDGVVVIENLFSDEEVDALREGLHQELLKVGIDHDLVLNGEQKVDGVRAKGKASRIFYPLWKLKAQLKIAPIMDALLTDTFGTNKGVWQHKHGKFDRSLAYIDRVCWRLPDGVTVEGGLNLHLDLNPYNLDAAKKWRPIQAFISLTDQYGSNSGGLRAVRGFHHEINSYFARLSNPGDDSSNNSSNNSDTMTMTKGEFFRMGGKQHTNLQNRCHPVNAPRGSLVCWDNRIPHATASSLAGFDTREVIYTGFLPNIPKNVTYLQQQWRHLSQNIDPPAYCERHDRADRDWNISQLSQREQEMLGNL